MRNYNVFRWAGSMLLDAARLRKRDRAARGDRTGAAGDRARHQQWPPAGAAPKRRAPGDEAASRPLAGDRIALFLDIDGTLLEHQPHPEGVRVDDALRDLLIVRPERLDGAVAFITGRR